MQMLDMMCVAMLSYIRNELLGAEASQCLLKVFHYPNLDDAEVKEVLRLAQGLDDGSVFDFDKTESQAALYLKKLQEKLADGMDELKARTRVHCVSHFILCLSTLFLVSPGATICNAYGTHPPHHQPILNLAMTQPTAFL